MERVQKAVNPSHSSRAQSSGQQAGLPSSSNASGVFLTPVSLYPTSTEMIGDEDLQKEHGSSGCAFYGQEADPVLEVEEEGMFFQTENQMPPNVFLRSFCTRAVVSRNAINAFCEYLDIKMTLDDGTRLYLYELKILLCK